MGIECFKDLRIDADTNIQTYKHPKCSICSTNTRCPTTYQSRHFFNKSKTNIDIATRFEQEYVCCVRNEEECVCSVCLFRCNIFSGVRIIKEMPGLVGSGTPYISKYVIIKCYNKPFAGPSSRAA